jgi:hypothetical protein
MAWSIVFTAQNAASAHCHVGASDLMNSTVLGWLEEVLGNACLKVAA